MTLAPESFDSKRFYRVHLGLSLVLAVLLLAVFEGTDLDRKINDRFFDKARGIFYLHGDWFLETVIHQWMKYVVIALAVGLGITFILSFFKKSLKPLRRRLIFLVLCLGLGPAAVAGLKATTNKHCPYNLDIYNGHAPYVRLLEAAPPGSPRGRCFPGGHASGGFALSGFYFVWYRTRPRLARAALVFAFGYGFIMGWGRMMQGAHFLSHNLWAALICWWVALLLYRIILQPGESSTHPSAG